MSHKKPVEFRNSNFSKISPCDTENTNTFRKRKTHGLDFGSEFSQKSSHDADITGFNFGPKGEMALKTPIVTWKLTL